MKKNLLKDGLIKYTSGLILVGLLIFVPAGTIKWFNGWLLMCLLFIPMLIGGIVMYVKAPDLLRSRLKAKEQQQAQKEVINYSGLMFLTAFIIAGLNERFKWHQLPDQVIVIASVIFLLGYLMFGEVLRENAFLSRTVEVQDNQKVIDTGLYGIIRHPMYLATVFMFLSMPLILNSILSFVVMLTYIPIIVKRIIYEEKLLESELNGYKNYKLKVLYKLFPFLW